MADTDDDADNLPFDSDNFYYDGEEHEGGAESETSETIHYDTKDFISGPTRVKNGTVPMNILEFQHSFAYDCQRFFNLCVADPNTLIFASGNLIHIFDVVQKALTFRRCSTGGGIGHITKNPAFDHIAIGENGINPPIIIYEWPSLEIVTVLRKGTSRSYTHLAYSPNGKRLVSQGGDPDYMLTIWNWERSSIILRCKSHGQDVYKVMFSPSVLGHLTTNGAGHVKFWKTASTFTGLKLQGLLGRFGKTEISDIIGVYPMPDEKVISGSEWGNILLWDEGLIKFEVCRRKRRPCHKKFISQFEFINGELISVGMDGWIRFWYYETIDQADPPDEDRFVEMEPIYEFEITDDTNDNDRTLEPAFLCIQKREPLDPDATIWYGQDANGGLWIIDLCTYQTPEPPQKILTCHAGQISDMSVCSWGPYVATFGLGGNLHVYNYETKTLILAHYFEIGGSTIIWLPCSVEKSGTTVICAFQSGIIRTFSIDVARANKENMIHQNYIKLIQVLKPHMKPITCMSANESYSLFVTGSEDLTIFVFSAKITDAFPTLSPVGFIDVPSYATCMTWKPGQRNTILVGCIRGDCLEVDLPTTPKSGAIVSYKLDKSKPRSFKFESVKSAIRRELFRLDLENKKEAKVARKQKEIEQLKVDNPGIEIDEEAYLMDSEDDPPLPKIFTPSVPNKVLFMHYTPRQTVWLSMAGYDSGYIYEYTNPAANKKTKLLNSTMVFDADDTEIRSCLFLENKYVVLGLENGEIRVCKINPEDFSDFSDYWILPMHDNFNGIIPKIVLSHDGKKILSCGHDGNLFSYIINDEIAEKEIEILEPKPILQMPPAVEDIEESDYPSLEQVVIQQELSRIKEESKRTKDQVLKDIQEVSEKYNKIVERNNTLPPSQRFLPEEFEIDPRITEDLNNNLQAQMDQMLNKISLKVAKSTLRLKKLVEHFINPYTCMPFGVKKILQPEEIVYSLIERKLGEDYYKEYEEITKKMEETEAGRAADARSREEETKVRQKEKTQSIENFLKGLSPSTLEHKLGVAIDQLLRKYRELKLKMEERAKAWKALESRKPDLSVDNPDDKVALKEATESIGDYKLKTLLSYNATDKNRDTVISKYKEILDARKKVHIWRENYNTKLKEMRTRKVSLKKQAEQAVIRLKKIHAEIPDEEIKPLPIVPTIDNDAEFPEIHLELEKDTQELEKQEKKAAMIEETIIFDSDEEYEVLLKDESLLYRVSRTVSDYSIVTKKSVGQTPKVSEHTLKMTEVPVETEWERQMKYYRLMKKLWEQDFILKELKQNYEQFDQDLDLLGRNRVEILADSIYMNLHLLTAQQELIVLREFESMENFLGAKVEEKIRERTLSKQRIQTLNAKIDQRNKEIDKLNEKIKDLQSTFINLISENQFYDFLKRIFKKKYKPPKQDAESSSSSESSFSESSSEGDVESGSAESGDIGAIHLDDSTCPPGCDQDLYDAAFTMRESRYELEAKVQDERKEIELHRKEVDSENRKMRIIEQNLKSNQEELQAYMQEKQRKLNEIERTIILKFHQIQNFIRDGKVENIKECVVFDKTKLAQLYDRVGELKLETKEQQLKHKKNRSHLHRLKMDCKYMEKEIKTLKGEIKREMNEKFGQEVSLPELYEGVLRKLVYDIKGNMTKITANYLEQADCVKTKQQENVDILKEQIRVNTEKVALLTALEEDNERLRRILCKPKVSEEESTKIDEKYKEELSRLQSVIHCQRRQIEALRGDVLKLCLKAKPIPPCGESDRKAPSEDSDIDESKTEVDLKTGECLKQFEEKKTVVKEMTSSKVEVKDTKKQEESSIDRISMIQHLMSRIIEVSLENQEVEEGTQQKLKEIIENIPVDGTVADLHEGIEKCIKAITEALSANDEEIAQAMAEAIRESLNDVLYKLDMDVSRTPDKSPVQRNILEKVNELFLSIGIQDNIEEIQHELFKRLRSENDIKPTTEFLLQNLPFSTDDETKVALQEYTIVTLTEIIKHDDFQKPPIPEEKIKVEEDPDNKSDY